MAVPSKITITQIQNGDPVDPTTANAPHTNLSDNIDNILTYLGDNQISFFENDPSITTGLTFGFSAGSYRENNVIATVASGTILLTDDSVNYVEIDKTGTVVDNATGFTAGSLPLWEVTTVAGAITVITDKRTWATSTDAENLNLSSTILTSTNVKAGIEEAAGNSIAYSIVFGS